MVLLGDWYHDLPARTPIWDTVLINNIVRNDCAVAQAACNGVTTGVVVTGYVSRLVRRIQSPIKDDIRTP